MNCILYRSVRGAVALRFFGLIALLSFATLAGGAGAYAFLARRHARACHFNLRRILQAENDYALRYGEYAKSLSLITGLDASIVTSCPACGHAYTIKKAPLTKPNTAIEISCPDASYHAFFFGTRSDYTGDLLKPCVCGI